MERVQNELSKTDDIISNSEEKLNNLKELVSREQANPFEEVRPITFVHSNIIYNFSLRLYPLYIIHNFSIFIRIGALPRMKKEE